MTHNLTNTPCGVCGRLTFEDRVCCTPRANVTLLDSAALDANDPRRDACVYQYCGQLASYACTAPHGATVNLCEEHATGFGRVWGIGTRPW